MQFKEPKQCAEKWQRHPDCCLGGGSRAQGILGLCCTAWTSQGKLLPGQKERSGW